MQYAFLMSAVSPRESRFWNVPFYLWCWVIFAVFAGSIFFLHHITLMQGDDYIYSFVFDATERGNYTFSQRVGSLRDIFDSQMNHYCYVNGRIVVHAIFQGILTLPTKTVWDVAATLCFFANAWLIVLLLVREKNKRFPFFLVVAGLYWLLMPKPAHTFFWMAGGVNYQGSALLCLLFVYLWVKPLKEGYLWLILPLGLAAGNSNEALSIGLFGGMFLYALMNREKMTFAHWCLLLCFALGLAANILSPGTRGRMDSSGGGDGLVGVLMHFAVGGREVLRYPNVLVTPLLLLFIAYLFGTRDKRNFVSFGLPISALISVIAVVYSGEINGRSLFGCFLWSFIAVLFVLLQKEKTIPHALRTGFYVLCAVSCAGTIAYAAAEISDETRNNLNLIHRMCKSKDSFVEYHGMQDRWYAKGLSLGLNKSSRQNCALSAYYGMNSSYGYAPEKVLSVIRDIPLSSYEDLAEGAYRHVGNLILVNLGSNGMIYDAKTVVCYSDLSFCPNGIYRMRYEAKRGEKYIANMALVTYGGNDFGIIFLSNIPQEKGIDKIRIKVLYRKEKKVWEFPLFQVDGVMKLTSSLTVVQKNVCDSIS